MRSGPAGLSIHLSVFVSRWNARDTGNRGVAEELLTPDLVAAMPELSVEELTAWYRAAEDYRRFEKEEASRQAFADKHGLAIQDEDSGAERAAVESPDFALVPRYDVEASAGAGRAVDREREAQRIAFRRDWLAERGLEAGRLAAIAAKGDSMEPSIPAGALLLLDLRAAEAGAALADGVYVIWFDHHLAVKRLQRLPDGSWLVISDNPLYKEWAIPPAQAAGLRVVGRVVWVGHELRG